MDDKRSDDFTIPLGLYGTYRAQEDIMLCAAAAAASSLHVHAGVNKKGKC